MSSVKCDACLAESEVSTMRKTRLSDHWDSDARRRARQYHLVIAHERAAGLEMGRLALGQADRGGGSDLRAVPRLSAGLTEPLSVAGQRSGR
eukprot:COSAG03_NODE_10059_length_675_cov_1.218750_1_plen_92_part_00